MAGRKQARHLVLGVVGVLVLIDEDVSERLLVLLEDVRILLKHLDRAENNVVKIEGAVFAEDALVGGVDARRDLLRPAGRQVLVRLRADELVLGAGDEAGDGAGRELLLVDIRLLHRALYRRE